MKIILTEDVVGLGDIGEHVTVKPGYARNFLIPRGKAVEVGAKSAKSIAHQRWQIDAKKKREQVKAEELAATVRNIELQFGLRVGSGGKVFGSIGSRDIAEKLTEQNIQVDRRRVLLAEPLKKPGTHFVTVKLHADVKAQVKVTIEKLAATKEEEQLETEQARVRIDTATAEPEAETTEAAAPAAE